MRTRDIVRSCGFAASFLRSWFLVRTFVRSRSFVLGAGNEERRTQNVEREPTNVQPRTKNREPRTLSEVQNHYNRANCSDVGSAQQYQGSLRYGIAARDSSDLIRGGRGAAAAAWAWAVSHTLREHVRPRRVEPHAHERGHRRLQRVHRRIGMRPRMRQRDRIERAGARAHVGELQHAGALRHEQANRELNGRHALDQIETIDRVQQFQIRAGRRPRRERDERGNERQADARGRAPPPARSPAACAPSRAWPARRRRATRPRSSRTRSRCRAAAAACRRAAAGARP